MSPAVTIHGRYQIPKEPIGQGGMGVVYKAYDTVTKRDVALKTLKGVLNPAAVELFSKEWTVLARLSHPNIVDIVDSGEFEEDGQLKPFFVMPLLRGRTLEYLIANASQRLTVERLVEIVVQTCRGLQAAHDQGLIHRDLKPSNIFVMDDDTVKIIDFGIVHLAETESIAGIKGTLQYMSPEQIEMKPMSPASDIFSLSIVCYEALTGRKPFARQSEAETADAIRRHIPPPICELNPLVTQLLSRVVHKAMAKAPWHRFSTAREYAETLQKALNRQPIERFERSKLQPRIERIKKAQAEGDLQFAAEVLTELEAEGHIDPEMTVLRMQLDQGIRQKSIRQLMDSARTRREEEEFPLALQKIQEVLEIDPENSDALSLRREIEKERSSSQIENWFRLVDQHIHNHSFGQARQGLQEVLKMNAGDKRALDLMVEVDRQEQEITRLRAEKEQLYQAALGSYQNGEVSSALSKLERVLEVNRRSPDSAIPDRDAQYQGLYNQIRTERDAARNSYAEGRKCLADRNFARALEICAEFLKKSPGDPLFQALKLEAEEQERQEQSAFLAEVARRAEAEADLDRRVNILKEAADRYPNERHFQQSLRLTRDRRDLVNSIVAKARQYEDRGQFSEALGQWDTLRNIYAQYPGVEFEIERVMRRRDEQVQEEARSSWVEQIDRSIANGDYTRAGDAARSALEEFPGDRELEELERLARQALERAAEAGQWLQRGQELCAGRQFGEGLDALRKAATLDNKNPAIRAALLSALVEHARSLPSREWRVAEALIQQALSMEPGHPLAKNLQGQVLDSKRQEIVSESISRARELQVAGNLDAALERVEAALLSFPNESRLVQLRSTLRHLAGQSAAFEPTIAAPAVEARSAAASAGALSSPVSAPFPSSPPISPPKAPEAPPPASPGPQTQEVRSAAEPFPVEPVPVQPQPVAAALNNPSGESPAIESSPPPPALQEPVRARFRRWYVGTGVAAALLVVAALASSGLKQKGAPSSAEHAVNIESNVPGAVFKIDGKPAASFPMRLAAGEHKAEAFLAGYRTESKTFNVTGPSSIVFHLEPEPVRIRLTSDLKAGQVSLDGQPPVELQEGAFSMDSVPVSVEHRLTLLQAGKESLSFSFKADPGGIAVLSGPASAKDIDVVLISSLGKQARIYATNPAFKGGVKGSPPQPIPPDGLPVNDLTSATEFVLTDGNNTRPLQMEMSTVPVLKVLLSSDPNTATLAIEANVSDADVTINGKKEPPLRMGRARYSLPPGAYSIGLTKDGYEPARVSTNLNKGQILPLPAITMNPVVRTASLIIEHGTPGAEVWIDGRQTGVLGADGSWTRDGISPEAHTIALKKADFEDGEPMQKTFAAGRTVQLQGTEAQLTAFGALVLHITPDNAVVTYKREDEPRAHQAANGTTIRLKAGRYMVAAAAPEKNPNQQTVVVASGRSVPVEWTLAAASVEARQTPIPAEKVIAGYFRDPAAWVEDNGWWWHKRDDVSWLRDNDGVYDLIVPRQAKGGVFSKAKRTEWIVDQQDTGNRIEFSLDAGGLQRKNYSKGKANFTSPKLAVAPATDDIYHIRIEIRRDRIATSIDGKLIDDYPRPPGEALGMFGFKGQAFLRINNRTGN